jgi:hypothetical protein
MKKPRAANFALCLNNEGYKSSLEVGKLYRVIPDKQAEAHGLIRVIDESGEDYAFGADRFHAMHYHPQSRRLCWKPPTLKP